MSEPQNDAMDDLLRGIELLRRYNKPRLAHTLSVGATCYAELRRICGPWVSTNTTDTPMFQGLRINLSNMLDSDQWVAFDRDGGIVATGHAGDIKSAHKRMTRQSPNG